MKTLKLTLLSLALALTAFAQATVVSQEGTGEAAIINKDLVKATAEAKEKALRAAIEQAAGVRINADTVVVNNQLVRDVVFANTSGFVKSSVLVGEPTVANGVVKVKVKAEIITENLDKDLTAARDLIKKMGRPSIVIVVQEQTIPLGQKAMINTESLATIVTDAMKADGWDIKDAQAMNGKLSLEGGATLGATDLKTISTLSKANYVLYGKVVLRHEDYYEGTTTPASGKAAMFPVTGQYDLALAATDSEDQITKVNGKIKPSNQILPIVSYEQTAFDLIKQRRDEIITDIRKAILEHFRDQLVNGKKISLVVKGLDYDATDDFLKAMEGMKGIKEATQDKFEGGEAHYRVTYFGSAREFASQVAAASFKKKKIGVNSVLMSKVEIQVGK